MQNKIKRKEILLKLLQAKTFDYINAKIIAEETNIESTKRPKEVLIKYKALLTNSIRDQKTLSTLEADYRFLSLEKSKVKKPWELITSPTILAKPASMSKRRVATYGLIGGIFLSILLIIISEKRKNLILTTKEIERILNLKIIYELKDPSEFESQKLKLLLDVKFKLGIDEKLALIKTSNVPDYYLDILLTNFQSVIKKEQILLTDNLLEAKKCSKQLIITSLNSLNRTELTTLNENLILQENKSIGILLFGKDII